MTARFSPLSHSVTALPVGEPRSPYFTHDLMEHFLPPLQGEVAEQSEAGGVVKGKIRVERENKESSDLTARKNACPTF